ncbi:hypothetical protein [Sporisorium scitamineum]|uniref:Uncharacterized protein n=1 Tax=Sporisorium scitamineum TaxID=49012 RepID=A0A0F7S0K6_9BASI|nr:hypothetical protein [Sporisorium scitamineum]
MCNSSAPRKKLNQLHLHFSRTRTDEVVYILRRLQPKIFRWEVSDADEEPSDYFEQHLPLTRSFAVLVNEYPSLGMNEWLSSLVDLSIIHFELDSDTAQLLAALPNLRRLAVGAKLMPDRSIEQIPILLTTGATRNNLEYLLVRLPVYLFNTHDDDEEQRANFLRRRALQCLVWADWGRV